MDDLQQQHQAEVEDLLKEKDKQLQEETAATMAGKRQQEVIQKSIHTLF